MNNLPPPPSLSLVIPAYNEASQIASTITTAIDYLHEQPYASELIVVDDGSRDATAAVAFDLAVRFPELKVLRVKHGGKATALRAGIAAASSEQIAFCDADLATPLTYLADLRQAIAGGCDLAIGSREGIGARRVGEPPYRHVMGRAFNLFVRVLVLPGLQDTQCGFKLFRRDAICQILERAQLYRHQQEPLRGPRVTAFDVELLVIGRRLGYKICPIPVVWTYGTNSKVQPARDTWNNFLDVLRVRLNAWRGKYN